MNAIAATGFATDGNATPELAAEAVKGALREAGTDYAQSVILMLSGHFARHAQAAVTAASRVARCVQVAGCTTAGVFTEKAWALDQPAAAALALPGPVNLGPPRTDKPRLTLAAGNVARPDWIAEGGARFGTVASSSDERSGGAVWGHGKVCAQGRFEGSFMGARLRTRVSRGMRMISPPLPVTDQDGYELFTLAGRPALKTMLAGLPAEFRELQALPMHLVFAAVPTGDLAPDEAFAQGCYGLLPVLGINAEEQSVTLASALPADRPICWALRDPPRAEREMAYTLDMLWPETHSRPAFAMMFSCIGRGPYFYQGEDRDLLQVLSRWPNLPVIGAYGDGEIGFAGGANSLLSYSSVIALAKPE